MQARDALIRTDSRVPGRAACMAGAINQYLAGRLLTVFVSGLLLMGVVQPASARVEAEPDAALLEFLAEWSGEGDAWLEKQLAAAPLDHEHQRDGSEDRLKEDADER